jgi:alpha-beta hydrolase superfamily lysophospholipase
MIYTPGGRHEMLNEINREEVRARLLSWMASLLEEQQDFLPKSREWGL